MHILYPRKVNPLMDKMSFWGYCPDGFCLLLILYFIINLSVAHIRADISSTTQTNKPENWSFVEDNRRIIHFPQTKTKISLTKCPISDVIEFNGEEVGQLREV